jgi:hypothetical protein
MATALSSHAVTTMSRLWDGWLLAGAAPLRPVPPPRVAAPERLAAVP